MSSEVNTKVSHKLQESYSNQYDSESAVWRNLGAIAKVENILSMALGYTFDKVLEVGAGEGALLQKLSEQNFCKQLYAIEISDSGIERIKERKPKLLADVLKFDGYKIPFADNEFDLVYCSHVMEHVEHPRMLLREIKRVSKHQIFEVPIDFSFSVDKKIKHFLSYGHINIFTPALFRFLLQSEGFELIKGASKMFDKAVSQFILKQKKKQLSATKFLVFKTRSSIVRVIWQLLPKKLKDIKPQTYTVLTKSTDGQLRI